MISFLKNIEFYQAHWLWLLLLLPVLAYLFYRRGGQRYATFRLPDTGHLELGSLRSQLIGLLPLIKLLGLALLILALARPRLTLKEEQVKAEGVDIVLAIDLSSSMLAQDFKPNRLEASKQVATEFVSKRPYDRIGLVQFAGEAFTTCPLTTDHNIITQFLSGLDVGLLEDGTAIGSGLATSVNRLKDSEAKSKIVILLTDGVNNTGYQSPMLAAKVAKEFGVKVYTIGVGTVGQALSPVGRQRDGRYVFGLAEVQIDEALLRAISDETGGMYFRATSAQALQEIYDEINKLEKTEIEVTVIRKYSEEFYRFAIAGMIALLLVWILSFTVLRAIP